MGEVKLSNDKMPFVGMQPGEIKITKEDYGSEVKRPWQQMKIAMFLCLSVYLVLTLILLLALATHTVPAILILILGVYMCRKLWNVLESNWFIVCLLAAIFLTLAFATIPLMANTDLLMALFRLWHYWLPLWTIGLLLITFVPALGAGLYRFLGEIVDSSGPSAPRAAIAWPGIVWPWQARQIHGWLNPPNPPESSKEMIEALRKVLQDQAQTIKVEILHQEEKGKHWLEFTHLPASDKQMQWVARMVLAGKPFSELEMSGADKPLTSGDQFERVRNQLMDCGALRWKSPGFHTQGLEWTPFGKMLLQRLAAGGNGHSPTPPDKGSVRGNG